MDGTRMDHTDDMAYGEARDDDFIWGTTSEERDTFHGDVGNDTLLLNGVPFTHGDLRGR